MFAVIDRFEGDFALCQFLADGEMRRYARSALPSNAKEGDVLRIDGNSFAIDRQRTKKRRTEMQEKMDRLWK